MRLIRRSRLLVADWLEPMAPEAMQVWSERDAMLAEIEAFLSDRRR